MSKLDDLKGWVPPIGKKIWCKLFHRQWQAYYGGHWPNWKLLECLLCGCQWKNNERKTDS